MSNLVGHRPVWIRTPDLETSDAEKLPPSVDVVRIVSDDDALPGWFWISRVSRHTRARKRLDDTQRNKHELIMGITHEPPNNLKLRRLNITKYTRYELSNAL